MARANQGVSNVAIPDPNTYRALCFWVIYLGTLDSTFKGEVKQKPKVLFGFELNDTSHVFNEEKRPQPFMVSQEMTLNTHDQSAMKKFLEDWRGVPLTKAEIEDTEAEPLIKKFLGKGAMITVVHNKSDDGKKTFANIGKIGRIPQELRNTQGQVIQHKVEKPKPINEQLFFDIDEPDWTVFNKLPQWIQKKIEKSPEYQAAKNGAPASSAQPAAAGTNDDF